MRKAYPTLMSGTLHAMVCVLIVGVIFLLDQWTKQWAEQHLIWGQALPFFQFSKAGIQARLNYNTGAAFGFLQQASGWQNGLFIGIAWAVLMLIFIHVIANSARLSAVQKGGILCLAGGTLGNVWDRMLHGHVIDFIDVFFYGWHWPTFNIADVAICVAACLLGITMTGVMANTE